MACRNGIRSIAQALLPRYGTGHVERYLPRGYLANDE